MSTSYAAVHFRLVKERGSASAHQCIGCDGPAQDWAYQHESASELQQDGLAYSENLDDYEPMCRSCHRKWDLLHNPEYAAELRTFRAHAARGVLWEEHLEKMREVGRRLGENTARRRKADEEFDRRLRAAASQNIRAALAANETLPAEKVSADRAAAARVANAKKRRCLDCGLTAHPAAVGAHLKGSGHSGYQDLQQ